MAADWFYSDGHWRGNGWWVCGELLCYTLALQVMAMEVTGESKKQN